MPGKPSRIVSDTTRPAEEWLKLEPVRLLRDYIRIDTSQGKSEEAGARFLKDLLDCEGIETELVCPAPGRCNLLARVPGKKREGALLLLNHIDVVDAYPQLWTVAGPFDGTIKGGYLYGRGAYDMKSLALAQALALRNLKRLGRRARVRHPLSRRGRRGARAALGLAVAARAPARVVCGGFGSLERGRDDGDDPARRPLLGTRDAPGRLRLGGVRATTARPLEDLAGRWKKLASTPVAPHPHVVLGFDLLANHLVNPLTDPLRHLDRVRRDPAELAALPDRYAAFLEARVFWTPPFPDPPEAVDSLRAYVIVSTPPGVDPGQYLAPIVQDAARSQIRAVWSYATGPTVASPYPTPFTELVKRVTEARYPGIPFGPIPTFGGYTTSIHFRARGIPTYGFSPIPMNITDSVRRHGNDERIFLRDYLNGVDLYTDLVTDEARRRE